jgi:hypothetical protein
MIGPQAGLLRPMKHLLGPWTVGDGLLLVRVTKFPAVACC